MIDLEKARRDPTLVFNNPAEVLANEELSRQDKIDILRRWEYDARELDVAAEENMTGNDDDTLDQILAALHELKADMDLENAPPTKQGGE